MKVKGIILAGGSGTRLAPITKVFSKQLIPVFDKPMFYYPLSTLMLAGIKEYLIVTGSEYIDSYKGYLGDGAHLGIKVEYIIQDKPNGIPEGLILGKDFIGDDNVLFILGDNIFYGSGLQEILAETINQNRKSVVFGTFVNNPSQFGVASVIGDSIHIEEKPLNPKSNIAVTGLYYYRNIDLIYLDDLIPSQRGELEITDLNNIIGGNGHLDLVNLGRGFSWFDCGSFDGLLDAANFIRTIEKNQGIKIGCIEEIAYAKKFISRRMLKSIIDLFSSNNLYRCYLERLLD